MRKSRKGTRLNEAQFFDSSLRPLTKTMKKLRLFPQSSTEPLPSEDDVEDVTKIRRNPQLLVRDQPSTEITRINYGDTMKTPAVKGYGKDHQDISIQMSSNEFLDESSSAVAANEGNEHLVITDELSAVESLSEEFRGFEEVDVNPESLSLKSNDGDDIFKEETLQGPEDGGNALQFVENNPLKPEDGKKEEKTWWKMIIDFLGFLWWKRDDKRESSNKTKKSEGRTLLTGNTEGTRIKQIYISSLGRDTKEKKRNMSVKPYDKRENDEIQEYEKFRIRQMSSPLY